MATKKPNKRKRPHPLKRNPRDVTDVGKTESRSVFIQLPDIGMLTTWWEGASFVMHLNHHTCNCTSDVIRVHREELQKLLREQAVAVTRVVYETDQGSFATHYLHEQYLKDVRRAMDAGVKVATATFMIPSKIMLRILKQLATR